MMDEFEIFFDNVKSNSKTLYITVPKNLTKYMRLNKGDKVKIMIKKTNAT
jgi:hypothetical protein